MKCIIRTMPLDIPIDGMEDGDLAEVTDWPGQKFLRGRVVQRHQDGLIPIGAPVGECYLTFFKSTSSDIRVRLLKPGDQINVLAE